MYERWGRAGARRTAKKGGKYKKESDIDIAIKGNIKTEDKYRIINEFDLINTIHKIDLVFIEELTKKELVENIDKEGVEIK